MKNKKVILLTIGLLILFSLNSYAETKKLEQIGRYTLVRIKGEVPTEEVMKTILDKYTGDIKYGFDLVGYGDLFLPFIDQIKTATFEEKQLPVGEKLIWMLFRSRGKVKVVQDIEWAGKEPLPVFSFKVKKNFKHYEFVMPKPCGNIALRKVEEIIPEAICDIKVTPAKVNINDPISVDMSGSQHAKSMEVDVFGPDGAKITTKQLTPDSPKWQTKFEKPGEYTFKGRAINVEGKASQNPCEAKTYINFPPICKLWTSAVPGETYVRTPIVIDASDSTDPDGEVVKADMEITDAEGNVIDRYSDSEKPFTWEKVFEKPGLYTVTGIVTDDFGAVSQPARIDFEVIQKRLFFLVDVGAFFAKGSHGNYISGRLGVQYMIVPDTLSLIISGGGAITLEDDPWKSLFMANALLNVHRGPFFIGAGAGFTTKVKEYRNSDGEVLGIIGLDVFNKIKRKGSLFFELRVPIGEDRSFDLHHKYIIGFMLFF